ncbi:hypothetical protein Gohar_027759, partial [Gossypium harknessii]|nr:hypothetical protein [Gossypium harknessii]
MADAGRISDGSTTSVVRGMYGKQGWLLGVVIGVHFRRWIESLSSEWSPWAVNIFNDLVLLIDRGYDNVLIQTDNLEAVKVIQERPPNGSKSTLIKRIHQLLSQMIEHWHIRHISREDNQNANSL